MRAAPGAVADPRASAGLDALGNDVRREIICILSEGPMAAGDIAKNFEISRPAVSKHLRVLENAGMIEHRTVGNRNIYGLQQAGFDTVRHWLDQFWNDALTRFALVAENSFDAGNDE